MARRRRIFIRDVGPTGGEQRNYLDVDGQGCCTNREYNEREQQAAQEIHKLRETLNTVRSIMVGSGANMESHVHHFQ
ncbi:hypothetical protein Gpo141_00008869 [Globisporangium polare]